MANQPDYDYLLKLDSWSKKDAALIVCGFDPLDYKSVRFSQKNLPSELQEAYKIYRIFCSVNFVQKYNSSYIHPFHYIFECDEKDIPIPEALRESVRQRYEYIKKREARNKQFEAEQQSEKEIAYLESSDGARERHYLLKIIGALAAIYWIQKEISTNVPNNKKVISHIVEDILQYLENQDLHSHGLGKSNLHKKISEGLAILKEE